MSGIAMPSSCGMVQAGVMANQNNKKIAFQWCSKRVKNEK